jgi:hypothetical protein
MVALVMSFCLKAELTLHERRSWDPDVSPSVDRVMAFRAGRPITENTLRLNMGAWGNSCPEIEVMMR